MLELPKERRAIFETKRAQAEIGFLDGKHALEDEYPLASRDHQYVDALEKLTLNHYLDICNAYTNELIREAMKQQADPSETREQAENFVSELAEKVFIEKYSSGHGATWAAANRSDLTGLMLRLFKGSEHWRDLNYVITILSEWSTQPRDENRRRAFIDPILTEMGLSVPDWANLAGVKPITAYDYLNGKKRPFPSTKKKLADALKIPVSQFPE